MEAATDKVLVTLPDGKPLELPAEIIAVAGSTVRVRFPDLSDGNVALIQKLAFLRHRRDIADARKARGT